MFTDQLPVYNLHEREWDSYEELCESFEWQIPDTFNTATYVCDRWAEAEPDRLAILAEDMDGTAEELTFGDLKTRSEQLANYLADRGVERGDRVALHGPQKVETVIACVAAWKLGAVAVPFSTLYGREGLRYRLDDSGAKAFVVDESAVDVYRDIADDVDLNAVLTVDVADPEGEEVNFDDALADADDGFETVETDAEDDAVIIYTSGTTSDPKGVLHAHRYLLSNLTGYQLHVCNMQLEEGDLTLTPVEWSWGATLYVIVLPGLYFGQAMVAYEREDFDPAVAFDILERRTVANYFAPRTVLNMMLREADGDSYDLSDVRTVSSGGETLDEEIRGDIRDLFGDVAISEAYGQTEMLTIIGSCNRYFDPKPGMIGRSYPGQEAIIVDPETAEPIGTGEIGEIAAEYEGNPGCFKRYWNKPEKTDEKIKNGYLLTEDLGFKDEDGYIGFHSRKDDVIISSGYRISPTEIEESLSNHDAVANVAVIGVSDEERGEIPKAYVVLASGYERSEDLAAELQDYVKTELAKYEYPRDLEFIESLPKTSTGKVRRKDLRQ